MNSQHMRVRAGVGVLFVRVLCVYFLGCCKFAPYHNNSRQKYEKSEALAAHATAACKGKGERERGVRDSMCVCVCVWE